MKNTIFTALVVAILTISVSSRLTQDLDRIHYPNCEWSEVEKIFHTGRHHGFYPIEEVNEAFSYLSKKAPEIITIPIASYEDTKGDKMKRQKLYAYALTSNAHHEELDLENKPGILFTGAHRADEPITVSQTLFIALYWVHRYHKKDVGMLHFLNHSVAWFIPVVNPDGYKYFLDNWKNVAQPPQVRKNRFKPKWSKCDQAHIGVDLNRNYDYNWTEGNGTECDQDYPGPREFSEIETQFVHSTIYGGHRDIKLAVNFMGGHGLWRMPHNITHLHHGHDLYHQVKNETKIDLNDTWTALTGDVTDYMYFRHNITAFTALVGIEGENGLIELAPKKEKVMEMLTKTLTTINYLYAMLPPNLEHDFTQWQAEPPHYINETSINATKYKLTLTVQAFNKGLAAKKNVHIGIQMNHGIHQNTRHSPPFHMHYELISEEQITRANDNEIDYRINGKFTSGELKQHNVHPLTTHWNRTLYHGHVNVTLYSNEVITIPERHFLRMYVLVHRKVGKNVNFDVKIMPADPTEPQYVLEHVTWSHQPFDDHEGLGGGAIFLIIMTIFLLLFVPLCVCYIYMKRTQGDRDLGHGLGGDYMMYKDDKGVEML